MKSNASLSKKKLKKIKLPLFQLSGIGNVRDYSLCKYYNFFPALPRDYCLCAISCLMQFLFSRRISNSFNSFSDELNPN